VDIRHFAETANRVAVDKQSSAKVKCLGFGNEVVQWLTEWGDSYRSGFSPEDLRSNSAGIEFAKSIKPGDTRKEAFDRWAASVGARYMSDPKSGYSNLPATDPSVHGGVGRGSNLSSTP
jgi:hypothetical protein